MTDDKTPGPTGNYPLGKLGEHDEGALAIGIGVDEHGNIHLNFGTSITWIAMPAEQAAQFGVAIIRKAQEAMLIKKRRS